MNGKGVPINHPLGSYWHLLGGAGMNKYLSIINITSVFVGGQVVFPLLNQPKKRKGPSSHCQVSPIITALGILRVRFQKIYCLHHWILLAKNQGFLASPVIRIRYVAFYEEFSSFQDIAAKEDPGWREYSSAQIVRYVCLSNWPSKGDVFFAMEIQRWSELPVLEKRTKAMINTSRQRKNRKNKGEPGIFQEKWERSIFCLGWAFLRNHY